MAAGQMASPPNSAVSTCIDKYTHVIYIYICIYYQIYIFSIYTYIYIIYLYGVRYIYIIYYVCMLVSTRVDMVYFIHADTYYAT